MELSNRVSAPIALVAHELGHVCTREEDFLERARDEELWVLELCADWYAYKWGFGREIARHRKARVFSHHGPGPGTEITEEGSDGTIFRYRITRNFYIKFVRTETKEGRVIETAAQRDARILLQFSGSDAPR